jgi:hypothetical protein
MMHRNPQGWFSHCAPPTDELKMIPITVRLRRPRPFSQLIGRCHALCYVIRHKERGPSTQVTGKCRAFLLECDLTGVDST